MRTINTVKENTVSAQNSINVIGNLTAEPELRMTSTGRPVVNFRIAVNERREVNGEMRERTEYFNVVAWNAQAENVGATCSTGTRVMVSGKLQIRAAELEGGTRYFTEINADEVGLALRWQQAGEVTKHNGKDRVSPHLAESEPF
jgi:single-strand DNA-binding protein